MRLPSAWLGKASWAKPVKTAGYREPEDGRQHDDRDDRATRSRSISASAPRRSAPASSAGKIIRPAVSTITPTSRTTNVGAVGAECPGRGRRGLLAGEGAAERERGDQRHEPTE